VVEVVTTWSLELFLLQGLPSETRWLLGQSPVGGARPELVRCNLFLGPRDVRLCCAYDRWERGEARGGGSETRHFIEKRTYTKVLLVHPPVPDHGQRQGSRDLQIPFTWPPKSSVGPTRTAPG
jgi:hypothetical protein